MSDVLRLALAGAAGAVSRYLFGAAVGAMVPATWPVATFVINMVGCLVMGLLTALGAERSLINPAWRLPLGTGFLGAFTTFSTWAVDSVRLFTSGFALLAVLNVLASAVVGVVAAMVGLLWGRTLFRPVRPHEPADRSQVHPFRRRT